MSSTYPITTSLKVVKEVQYIKETVKGSTPTSPTFTAIPVSAFTPITAVRSIRYIKIGNTDLTKVIKNITNYAVAISYSPIDTGLLESMINMSGTNNREDSFTFLLSQQHNSAGTLVEQYQIARGCCPSSITIQLNARGLIKIGSRWLATSISDWSTTHGLSGTPTFASATTGTPWASTNTSASPIAFLDIGPGGLESSYDVRSFIAIIIHNTARTHILDPNNTVRLDQGVRDISIDVDIVYKDSEISESVRPFIAQDIQMKLNVQGSVIIGLTFTDVWLEKYDEIVNANSPLSKVVSYHGTAGQVSITQVTQYVTANSIQKYNMGGKVSLASIHKYNLASGVVTVVSESIQKFSRLAYISTSSKHKYHIGSGAITVPGSFEDENFVSENFVLDT